MLRYDAATPSRPAPHHIARRGGTAESRNRARPHQPGPTSARISGVGRAPRMARIATRRSGQGRVCMREPHLPRCEMRPSIHMRTRPLRRLQAYADPQRHIRRAIARAVHGGHPHKSRFGRINIHGRGLDRGRTIHLGLLHARRPRPRRHLAQPHPASSPGVCTPPGPICRGGMGLVRRRHRDMPSLQLGLRCRLRKPTAAAAGHPFAQAHTRAQRGTWPQAHPLRHGNRYSRLHRTAQAAQVPIRATEPALCRHCTQPSSRPHRRRSRMHIGFTGDGPRWHRLRVAGAALL